MDIDQKINDLFDFRMIPEFIQWGKSDKVYAMRPVAKDNQSTTQNQQRENNTLLNSLKDLQKDIYYLDKNLESKWKITPASMYPFWTSVRIHLYHFGYNEPAANRLLYRLKVYEEAELNIRLNKLPSSIQIRPFYYFKSCDVKLIRDIIYDQFPSLKLKVPKVQWIYFDLLTEVIDDIEDEIEDRVVYNGNRFLFSLYHKGIDQTILDYQSFLSRITNSITYYSQDFVPIIYTATNNALKLAEDLLDRFEFKENPKFVLEHMF